MAKAAFKSGRKIYWRDQWYDAAILDLDKIRSGNVIEGPAVVEAPASTMVVPPGRTARLDAHRIFHMSAAVKGKD